jgi:pSer/pThr/pTyr-binding forkhead associated (FHA) protein
MAKLMLSMDGLVLKEVVLTKERTSIGRKPHNDLVIDNLAVSGEHAVIVTILADSFLEDLGSTNGTFVNGQPIKKHFLQNGDTIELGKYKLKYVAESSAASSPGDFDKTMVVRTPDSNPGAEGVAIMSPEFGGPTNALHGNDFDTADSATADLGQTSSMLALSPATNRTFPGAGAAINDDQGGVSATAVQRLLQTPVSEATLQASMRILNGSNAGRELLISKALTTLGRPGVQVAVITRRPQGFYVTHVEGAHYPVVNEKPLGPEAYPLADGDVLELSGTRMHFSIKAAAPSRTTEPA